MRKAFIVGLIVLVAVTGIPIIVGMPSMTSCQGCGTLALYGQGCAFAILTAGAVLLLAMWRRRLGRFEHLLNVEFHRFALERPLQVV